MIFFVSQYKLKGQIKAYGKSHSRLFLDCNYENYSYDGTSIKTRIETSKDSFHESNKYIVMMGHPLKQGLKLLGDTSTYWSYLGYDGTSIKTRIETIKKTIQRLVDKSYDGTSIKTRIETV